MSKKHSSEKKGVPGGYPTQAAPYPTQSSAAAAAVPPGAPPPYNYAGAPGAPPPYLPAGAQPYGYGAAPYGAPAAGTQQQYAGPPPPGAMYPPQQQQQTYVIQGGFDAGARFDGISRPNIPPPPPGHAPNMAQMAAIQGHNVMMTQRPSGFWDSGSDGGYTLW